MRFIGSLDIVLAVLAGVVSATSQTIKPIILSPLPPLSSAQKLDPCLASFSIEFSYLPSFGGNLSSPNLLTKALMERIVERTGVGPDVRPGGITIDSSVFSPNAPALLLNESPTGGIYRTTFGPAYYESLAVFPNSSQFVIDVNLGNDTIEFAREEFVAAIQHVGWDRIRVLELGNEPDHYAGGSRPSGWTSLDYSAQFLGWTAVLTRNLSLPTHIFQAGGIVDSWSTKELIDQGIDSTGVVKTFAQHMYQYSTCDPVRDSIATLPNLVNHQNITAFLDGFKPQIAAAKSVGKDFVVGEYNSVSCSGKENVTNTFGQALWLADTVLYSASLGVSRMYLHQGATLVLQSSQQANTPGFSWYDLWYPAQSDRFGAPHASPSFVAYLLIAEAVGSSNKSSISYIPSPQGYPQLAAFAIYDTSLPQPGVSRLVLLNLSPITSDGATPNSLDEITDQSTFVDLNAFISGQPIGKSRVKRMTAPGLEVSDASQVTWAGQSYEGGSPSGQEVIEHLQNGSVVSVRASEGVIVFL